MNAARYPILAKHYGSMGPPRKRNGRPGKAARKPQLSQAPARPFYPKQPDPANGETIIEIAAGPFGDGFDVTVRPKREGEDLDAHFADYRRARGWAGGLRMTHGWRIIDHVGDKSS